jgi:hypothetical protein
MADQSSTLFLCKRTFVSCISSPRKWTYFLLGVSLSLSLSPPLFPCDLTYLVREVHRIPGLDLAWGQTHVLDHPVWNFPIALGKPIVRCIGFPKLAMSIYVASGNQTMQWNIPYIWNLLEPLVGKSSKSTFGYRMVRMG